jgi:hypothetical protein
MAAFFLILLCSAAVAYMQKIFAHYELLKRVEPKLRNTNFGDFFYGIDFSIWRIKAMAKLGSLIFLRKTSFIKEHENSVTKINSLIRITLLFIVFALIVLFIGLLTGTIK